MGLLALGFAATADAQSNTCQWANDNECDEARYGGTGACEAGTDANDCRILAAGGDDSCQWANDGECDDSRYGGTGVCTAGTDTSDCRILAGGGDDSCKFANDGACDEARYGGSGACVAGADRSDCSAVVAIAGTDSCEYAHDRECDDAQFGGTGACAAYSDASDCLPLALGGLDSCEWANDGECDEARYGGTGACVDGSDLSDCSAVLSIAGTDACEYANDSECDDAQFGGSGFCPAGSDASDCVLLALGGRDNCIYANDGVCDEPRYASPGAGYCASGSDVSDCAPVAFLYRRTNECPSAFDGQCDEPDAGTGRCEALTDTADCIGRGRPPQAYDHYFGRDDRFLPDSNVYPWSAIGYLELPGGASCTATLVGPRTVLTAAHCVLDENGGLAVPTMFRAGYSNGREVASSPVVGAMASPNYSTVDVPNNDWALVTLKADLGAIAGTIPVHMLTDADIATIQSTGLIVDQAGYSWDTADSLSAHVGCRVIDAIKGGAIVHECDTTNGDSGSPFLLTIDGQPQVIAVDSQFINPLDRASSFAQSNMAVDSRVFADAVAAAIAR